MTGLHVEEMVDESAVAGRLRCAIVLWCIPKKAERRQHALACLRSRDPPALDADDVRGQTEADGRDARERRGRPAVRHQSVSRVRRLPEIAKRALLNLLEECGFRLVV